MQQLSLRKRLAVIRLFLDGLSYDEMASKTGVSKGAVTNIVADLRAGRILDVQGPADQLDLLRELAVDLRRLKLTPSQAVVGVAALSHLQELEIEPADIQRWAAVYHDLAASESDRQAFVKAALYVEQLRKSTGLTPEELEAKAHSLEQEVAHLEPLAQEVREYEQQLPELRNQRQALTDEISQLEKRRDPLHKEVSQKEQREAELSHRVLELEQRAQIADTQLAQARKELENLAKIGLSPDDLSALGQRVAGVAQRHNIEPKALRERLLRELEALGAKLGIESSVALRRREFKEIEASIVNAQRERTGLEHALEQMRQQQTNLHEAIAQEQAHVLEGIQAAATVARNAVNKLEQDLKDGTAKVLAEVREIRNRAIEAGQELGYYKATVESNQWLQTLASLATGNTSASAGDVRVAGLVTLRGLKGWALRHPDQLPQAYWISMQLDRIIEEVERWQV